MYVYIKITLVIIQVIALEQTHVINQPKLTSCKVLVIKAIITVLALRAFFNLAFL